MMYALVAASTACVFIGWLYHAACEMVEAIGLARCDVFIRDDTVLLVDHHGSVHGETHGHRFLR